MIKGYKIRIYPTKEQETLIWKHIGACRFIWNYMLDMQKKRYADGEKYLTVFDMNKLLTPLKKQEEYQWLKEVSNASLRQTCGDLNGAYQAFFKRHNGFVRYKNRKHSKPSYPVRSDTFRFENGYAAVAKLGRIKYKSDFQFPEYKGHKYSNVRISYVNGKYMLSFGMERENQAPVLTDKVLGIDLGIKDLAVCAYGDEQIVFHNINKSRQIRRLNQRIRYTRRGISRKYEASRRRNSGKYVKTNNIIREEEKLKLLYVRLTNIRHNYLHHTTHKLISLLPARVIMEDLNVSGMMKNRHLSKAIAEQCFYEFIRQMKYKCKWNSIPFIQADRFYPSSKTCSCCGAIKKDLRLSDRTYVCQECGCIIDRDFNAAINLTKYAA